jgi:hypothetical protein
MQYSRHLSCFLPPFVCFLNLFFLGCHLILHSEIILMPNVELRRLRGFSRRSPRTQGYA